VQYFCDDIGKVVCVLLAMTECTEASTGNKIFQLVDNELGKRNIPWENCMSFAADNASVMMGKLNGVAAFLSKKAPAVYMLGCVCHLSHLAASKAANALVVKVDELLIDIFYYLDKSSKRHQELQHFQKLHDVEIHKILKHVSVRWLSIGICLSRLLEQWAPLAAMFRSEYEAEQRKVRGKKTNKGQQTCKVWITKEQRPV